MSRKLKSAKDFSGYWLKGVKEYRGHEGEPLFQGNLYLNNKKVGFFAMGDWGGPATIEGFSDKERKALEDYAISVTRTAFEPETSFVCSIMEAIDRRKYYLTKCRTKTLIRLPEHSEVEYCSFNFKFKGREAHIRGLLDEKYGKGNYQIINEEL